MADCGIAPRLAEVQAAWVGADRCNSGRGHACSARGSAAFLARQARPAQRALGLHARGNAVSAASLSGSPLVSSAARSRRRIGRASGGMRPGRALAAVEDPEIPALSIVDLGLDSFCRGASPTAALEVGLSPTYVGCPATEVIRRCGTRMRCASRRRPIYGDADVLVARLEQRLDHRGGPAQAAKLRHRSARAAARMRECCARPAGGLSALPFSDTESVSDSARRPARRCTAADTVSSPSNISNASDARSSAEISIRSRSAPSSASRRMRRA